VQQIIHEKFLMCRVDEVIAIRRRKGSGVRLVRAFGFFAHMAKSIYIRKRKKGQVHYLVVEAGD
jgi:hypothetical protein